MNVSNFGCSFAIEEYDREHNHSYTNLTAYEQEDFNRSNCTEDFFGMTVNYNFVIETTFTAVATGFYLHEMVVSDGDSNRSKRLTSHINKMDLVESQEYNHEPFTYNSTHSIYMKDMNNDGNKDLIYISGLDSFFDKKPLFVIEYREGKTLLNKVEYNIENLTQYDLDDYYINDLNGDGKLDVLFVYNVNNTSDHTSYGKMLQKSDGTLDVVEKFSLDNRDSLVVDNILGNGADEIIILGAENYSSVNQVKIYGQETNKTINTTLPIFLSNYTIPTQLLTYDLDKNGKKDIIVVNKNFKDDNNQLNFVCSVLSQEDNGSFIEKKYETLLKENMDISEYETIMDVKILDIDDIKDIWVVLSTNGVYFLKLEDNYLKVINTFNFEESNTPQDAILLTTADINRDGKQDLVLVKSGSDKFMNIFIQKDNLEFLSAQSFNFTIKNGSFNGNASFVLGDIDNDEKYELFVTTGEEKLSVLYLK